MENILYIPRNYLSFLILVKNLKKKDNNLFFINKKHFSKKSIESINYLKDFYNFSVLVNYYHPNKIKNNNYRSVDKIIEKENISKIYSSNDQIEQTIRKCVQKKIKFNLICHGYGSFINIYLNNFIIKKILNMFLKKSKDLYFENYLSLLNIIYKKKKLVLIIMNQILKKLITSIAL